MTVREIISSDIDLITIHRVIRIALLTRKKLLKPKNDLYRI